MLLLGLSDSVPFGHDQSCHFHSLFFEEFTEMVELALLCFAVNLDYTVQQDLHLSKQRANSVAFASLNSQQPNPFTMDTRITTSTNSVD